MTISALSFPTPTITRCIGPFTRNKQPQSVDVEVTGATPGGIVYFLTSLGSVVSSSFAGAGGDAHAYDLDDGSYVAYEVGTGNAWSIVVSGTTVTVIQIATTGSPIVVYAA